MDEMSKSESDDENTDLSNPDNLRDVLFRIQTKLGGDKIPTANIQPNDDTKPLDEPPPVSAEATIQEPNTHKQEHNEAAKPTIEGQTFPSANTATNMSNEHYQGMARKVDRETRQVLRRVQDHLIHAQKSLGAIHETVDLMEVIHHPDNTLGELNYTTPRRKTAWVSADQIQHGIDNLIGKDRHARVVYIEGLLPPLFAKNLRKLNLSIERETPIMVYLHEGYENQSHIQLEEPKTPYNMRTEIVENVSDAAIWWYIWENAYYDVFTLGVEPIAVGKTLGAVKMGNQIDILLRRDNFPIGVARVTIHEKTAHIVTIAILREQRTAERLQLLQHIATYQALQHGCDLIFAPGETEDERKIARALGFMDFGSIVCYSAKKNSHHDKKNPDNEHKPMAQPILNLKRPIQ